MLPTYIRFKVLKQRGIARSWPYLKDLIEDHGFPAGKLLSPQVRVWDEGEVSAWLETRPVEPAPPRGFAARRAAEKAARLQHLTEQPELEKADEADASTRLKSSHEMRHLFDELPEACDNTLWIAERADVTIEFGKPKLPTFPLPAG